MTTLHTLLLDISKLPEESVGPGIMARVREELKGMDMTPTDADVRGDLLHRLAKFSDEALESAFEGQDFDGGQAQETAIKHGLLVLVKFDPEAHDDRGVGLEAGDDFYEYAPDFSEALSTRPIAGEAVRAAAHKLALLVRRYVHTDEHVPMEEFERALFVVEDALAQQSQPAESVGESKPVCSTYHSRAVGVACSNCGHSKEAHQDSPPQQGETSEGWLKRGIEENVREVSSWPEHRRPEHMLASTPSTVTPDAIDEAMKSLETLIKYGRWTISEESPGHHPTLPSAIAQAQERLTAARIALEQSKRKGG